MRARIMRDVQCEQCGRSMRVSDGPEKKYASGMTLPCIWRERAALSVTDRCRYGGGDETSMRFGVPELLVNIAHFPELIDRATQG